LSFVRKGRKHQSESNKGQAMPQKHTRDEQERRECEPKQGIIVPLDLPEFEIVSQCMRTDGRIEVQVRAKKESDVCPRCGEMSENIHDRRKRVKRDSMLRSYQMTFIVEKRRFRCATCRRPFTETESACGRYKRTTERFRQQIVKNACQRPITHVAQEMQVGTRFVQNCLRLWIEEQLEKKGQTLDDQAKLPTPQLLGIDEFALRKGHRYDTILCDLEARDMLEINSGRKKEEVVKLLKRLNNPDAVQAVSMDMSASFRPAVQEALPNAQIVVDHFHVIQHIMKAFRKVLSSWAHKKEGMILLHGKQHLFLRPKERLTQEEMQERERIGTRLPALEKAWQLKEALRTWYATATGSWDINFRYHLKRHALAVHRSE
jgi:transposase